MSGNYEEYTLEALIELYANTKSFYDTGTSLGLAEFGPVRIAGAALCDITLAVEKKRREALELDLWRARARLESLKTRSEMRTETEAEIARLTAALEK